MFIEAYDKKKKKLKVFTDRVTGHNIHTPFSLVETIISDIESIIDTTSKVAVLYNIEFVLSLIAIKGINPKNITFFGDCPKKKQLMESWQCKYVKISKPSDLEKYSMKFDVVIGNPPYQNAVRSNENTNQGGGKKMYVSMMENSSNLLRDNGVIAFVVPSAIFKTTTFGKFGVAISGMKNFKILCANTDVSQHFKNVSIKICYFIGKKTDDNIKAVINGEETNYNQLGFYTNETELQTIAEKLINNKIPIKIFRDKNLNETGLTTTRYGYLEFDKTAEETNLFWVHSQPSKLKRLLKTNMFARVAWDGFVILDKRWYHNFWSALYLHPDLNENMSDDEIMDLYGLTQNEKDIINKIDRTKNVK